MLARPRPDPTGPGQESVWDYPRPPRAEPAGARIAIEHRGRTLVDTMRAVRVLETSHPPTYYVPPGDILPGLLRPARGGSTCEWKGRAAYWDVVLGDAAIPAVAWSYPSPTPAFAILKDHVAFYAAPFDRCTVDGERATPQPGGFYGGWVTSRVAGPFKGAPGSEGW